MKKEGAMKVGITLEDKQGLDSRVSQHFGQCQYFLIADVEDSEIKNMKVVANTAQHGGGGCRAVDEILQYGVNHIIAGGMGMNAQYKLSQAGVEVHGYSGKAGDAIRDLLKNKLKGLDACREHGDHH